MSLEIPRKCEFMNDLIMKRENYVAIYARESKKGTDSIEILTNQVTNCMEYAKKNGFIVCEVYQELVSASNTYFYDRTEFMRLVNDAKKGCFKKVIVTKRDRVSRNYDDFMRIKNLFKSLNVEFIYSSDIQLTGVKDYAANFIENMMMAIAQFEPSNISKRTKDGKNAKKMLKIYFYPPSFGHIKVFEECEKDGDKVIVTKYKRDGFKADLVKSIFTIYLSDSKIINAKDVLERIKDSKYFVRDYNEEESKQYHDLIKYHVTEAFIRDTISKPIYATLQTIDVDHKYENFSMKYNGKDIPIERDLFTECDNVDEIITDIEWLNCIGKWIKNNPFSSRKNRKQEELEAQIFKNKLYCKKCGKIIKVSDKSVTCGTKGCLNIRRNKFVQDFVKSLFIHMKIQGVLKDGIKNTVYKLNKKKNMLERELRRVVFQQAYWIERYVNLGTDNYTENQIKDLNMKQTNLKNDISLIVDKIDFLQGKFEKQMLPAIKNDYLDAVIDEIIENHSSILEIFVQNHIKELNINGKIIGILP